MVFSKRHRVKLLPTALARKQSSVKAFDFLALPAEIRAQIYSCALISHLALEIAPTVQNSSFSIEDSHQTTNARHNNAKKVNNALLLTCRIINEEASPILYGRNTFTALDGGSWIRFENWLTQIGENNTSYLHKVYMIAPVRDFKLCYFQAPLSNRANLLRRSIHPSSYRTDSDAFQSEYSDAQAFQNVCAALNSKGQGDVLHFRDTFVANDSLDAVNPLVKRRSVHYINAGDMRAGVQSRGIETNNVGEDNGSANADVTSGMGNSVADDADESNGDKAKESGWTIKTTYLTWRLVDGVKKEKIVHSVAEEPFIEP